MREMETFKDLEFMLRPFGCLAASKTRTRPGRSHDTGSTYLLLRHWWSFVVKTCNLGIVRETFAVGWDGHVYGQF